jgi:D-threo-aldose 1-dehydrogenase
MPETFGYRVTERMALDTVEAALDSPLNWLDTAWKYGESESHRRIGAVLKGRGGLPRGAMLDTKIGRDAAGNWGADVAERLLRESFEALQVDHIPLVFVHDPEEAEWDDVMGPNGAIQALMAAKADGRIGAIGVAGGKLDLMRRYVDTGIFEAVITHNRYTLLNRSAEGLIQHCHEIGLPILNAAPYASGLLANPNRKEPRYAYGKPPAHITERLDQIEAICARWHVPVAAVALQFSLRDERITSTIVGMTGPQRIDQTLALAQILIRPECWDELMALPFDTQDISEQSIEGHA